MKMPSGTTRALINQRIARAGIAPWLTNADNTENTKKAIRIVKEVLLEHASIEAAFLTLVEPRIERALDGICEFTLTDLRFSFLADSIASRSLVERLALVRLLLSYAEERPEDEQTFTFTVALTIFEETVHFKEDTPLYALAAVVYSAIMNRMCRDGEHLPIPALQSAVRALEKFAERAL